MDFIFSEKFVCYVTKKQVLQLYVICVLLGQVRQTSGRSHPSLNYMDHNHETHSESSLTNGTRKELLVATTTAQTIYIPKSEDPDAFIYSEWTIVSRLPNLRIGITTVNQYLDYYQNNSVNIDIYDGRSAESNKLSYWHGLSDFYPHHFKALTSTSNVLFLNYTARGGPIDLHMDLVYYLCGGTTDLGSEIGSPIFDRNTTFEVPELLECTWTLKKPPGVTFGLLRFYTINVPDCKTLSVTSENGQLLIFDTSDHNRFNYSTSEKPHDTDEFEKARKKLRETLNVNRLTDDELETNVTDHHVFYEDYNTIQEVQICNNSVQGILFNASEIKLIFSMLYPEKKYMFRANFQSFYLPSSPTRPPSYNSVRNWFINYGALVFCSVGIVLGFIIMYSQARRWSKKGKQKSFVNSNLQNKTGSSRNATKKLYSDSQNGSLMGTHDEEQLVELRDLELSFREVDDESVFAEETFYPNNFSGQTPKNLNRIEKPPKNVFNKKASVHT